MSRGLFRNMFNIDEDAPINKVKTIISAAEDILDSSKILLNSVIEMTDAFGARQKEKEDKPFGRPLNKNLKGFSSASTSGFTKQKTESFFDDVLTRTKSEFGRSKSFLNLDDISNLADVIEYVSSEVDAPITYGVKTVDESSATFVIAPNLYIIENRHGDIVLHVNVDAPSISIKKTNAGRIAAAFMALANFVKACLEFTTAEDIEASFSNNALILNLDNQISINAGLVILMIKALKDSDAENGFIFNVSDYRCKVSGNKLIIGKDGYTPASIPVAVFEFLHENAPAFSDLEIDDTAFRQYSDNPNELFVRMILELMKTHDLSISMDDIKIIDNVVGTNIKNNTLGIELRKIK